ncbi:response regulator receiver protein [Desulfonispora thiosulfatigenes DSM 11270]|uniref:Response regulator receiver protein n=1 Tax=Desulfonispora thiosulfatigenes DSM 11270 TaxID=656914 RepID=A0A1W1V698_DESTI|nr:hypothetical protein [Desulfonispora thiosulfatigenes]SMB88833.1 response regulator receiver protein [Desulfonispora thiosulfatigenes DSM 11270]
MFPTNIVKPFSPRELVHRVRVLLERTLNINNNEQNILKFPRLKLELGRDDGLDYISTLWGVGYKFEVTDD